jgi:asparagine synthase (glutamine-hydrolysing)
MCGITGLIEARRGSGDTGATATAMATTLAHRGPDDAGQWSEQGVALGFRRLAIIDLSTHGHQPMTSASGRYVLVFNGEIYNFAELRADLQAGGTQFRGTSDSEVLLEGIATWGVRGALDRCNGMFAIAVWDREHGSLTLARDRLGEKPLYYGWAGETFVFGSEIKALRAHPDARFDVDRGALGEFFRFGYVPAPSSIYQQVRKVPPGTMLEVRPGDLRHPVATTYWSAFDAASAGIAQPWEGTDREATDQLEELLRDSVRLRMVADVPVGAFLSGGIDSSTVVALMQQVSSRAVRTFSIGFRDPRWNEAHHAAEVARHLGTDHTELYVTADDALAVIPELAQTYDEPFGDSSQIPTVLISRLAREHVTVALSGDGGDEVFGGYDRYGLYDNFWRRLERVPLRVRRLAAAAIDAVPATALDRAAEAASPMLPRRLRTARPGPRLRKLGGALPVSGVEEAYHRLASHWDEPGRLVLGAVEPATPFTDPARRLSGASAVERCMYLDTVSYLPDDILTKVDRATMSVSLEGRIPILDHRVVELAWRLPLAMKRRGGTGKWVLREVLARHVPTPMFERTKMGFGVPVGDWLRGPLREWGEDLLAERRLRDDGYLHAPTVRSVWMDHLAGRRDATQPLWDVLMFQAWLESQTKS